MGTALTGLEIKDTYDGLVKTTDNGPISGTLKALSDGLGNDSTLSLSTTAASIAGTLAVTGVTTFSANVGLANAFSLTGRNAANTINISLISRNASDRVIIDPDGYGTNIGGGGTVLLNATGGNVGIGTSTPNLSGGAAGSTILTVSATSSARNGILELNGTRTTLNDYVAYVRMFNNGAATPVADIAAIRGSSDTTGSLTLSTSNAERVRITDTGNVGIGTSSPNSKLNVVGDGFTNGLTIKSAGNTGTFPLRVTYATGTDGDMLCINDNGNVGIGTSAPTELLHLSTTLGGSTGVGTAIQITSGGAGGDQAFIGVNKGVGNGLELSVENRDIIFNTGATTPFGGTERMRITSTGNVGIGTSSPARVLTLKNNAGATNGISFQSLASTSEVAVIECNQTLDTIDFEMVSNYPANGFRFLTGSPTLIERARFTANGLTFNGDTAAANALDDYEEGTFTATLKGSTTDPTTPVTTTANYTKIGRQVTISVIFTNVNTTGAAGAVSVSGLPFTVGLTSVGAVLSEFFDFGGISRTSLGSFAGAGGSIINFFATGDDATFDNLLHSAGTGRYLWTSITYFV